MMPQAEQYSHICEPDILPDLEEELVPEYPTSQPRSWVSRAAKIAGVTALLVTTALVGSCAVPAAQRSEAFGFLQKKLSGLTMLVVKKEDLWCQSVGDMPTITSAASGPPMRLKVLTYNLFWWNLFKKRGGNDQSAGKLIAASHAEAPFDLMGFQECEDGARVLADAGLDATFHMFQGEYAKCMAFNKEVFTLDAAGDADVAADNWWNNYGKRGMQWMRLKHATGRTVMFANHHGPLSVNSGGLCGGEATGKQMLGHIGRNYVPGDAVVLVGDFNSNAASLTVQEIRKHLVHVFNGEVFGGIDNIFANTPESNVVKNINLGRGGSDHDALASIIDFGSTTAKAQSVPGASAAAITSLGGVNAPRDDWEHFWCGLEENNVGYTMPTSVSWSKTVPEMPTPDRCCKLCQADSNCASWVWIGGSLPGARDCAMYGVGPTSKTERMEVVSGLSAKLATQMAAASPHITVL